MSPEKSIDPQHQVQKVSKKPYRYPGARPFSANQQDIFFGREKDIRNLYRLINIEQLIVLYSKSGMGKSSLLNAGVLPKIQKDDRFHPISIRFGAYTEDTKDSPLENCRQMISTGFGKSGLLNKILPGEDSLWVQLKERWYQSDSQQGFLLVFDQFEELFTYPEADIQAFKMQLVDVLNSDIPHNFREALEQQFQQQTNFLSEEEMEMLHTPVKIKVVMAIRSDRMSLMTKLSDYLPNVLSNCYELDALRSEQAEDAILNPAFKSDFPFASPPFDYKDEAIEQILQFLTRDNTQKIESFQLQILCQYIERKVIEKQLKLVSPADIGQIENIYKNYYDDQIASLGSEEEQYAARLLIEEGLIFEEEERRLTMYEGQIHSSFDISPELLSKLVDTHLLRAEPSMRGGYTYELSHDTLVLPILGAKQKRKAKEEQLAAQKAEEAQKLKLKELYQERRRYRLYAIGGFLLAILAFGASIIAFSFYQKAHAQKIVAEKNAALAQEQSQLAKQKEAEALKNLELVHAAEQQKKIAKYNEYLARGKAFMSQSNYVEAIQEFETAIAFNPDGQEGKELVKISQQKYDTGLIFDRIIEEGDVLFSRGSAHYIEALEKYRAADKLDYDDKVSDRKISFVTARLEGAFVEFINNGETFYKAKGYGFALEQFQEAQRIRPNDKEVRQKIEACKAKL